MASLAVVPQFCAEGIGAHLRRLDSAVSRFNLARGTELFAQGDPCDRVFVLLAGRVKLSTDGPDGKSCLFHIVEPGEVIDESVLLGERSYRAAAHVVESASVVSVPIHHALRELETRPELWRDLAPLFRTRLRNLEDQLQWVCFLEVEQRVIKLLLRWAENRSQSLDGTHQFRLSQEDLSDMIGATRETTSTALNRLRRAGCVDLGRRSIVVRSVEKLRQMAGDPGRRALKPVAV